MSLAIMAFFTIITLLSILKTTSTQQTNTYHTIRCQPLTLNEMKSKLFSFGGIMDKTYVARTIKDAMNFTDLCLTKPRPTTEHPSEINFTKIQTRHGTEIRMNRKCHKKGTSDSGLGLVRICTECAITTILPNDFFPRYINEVTCVPPNKDQNCFQGEGLCVEVKFSATFLRKTPLCVWKRGKNRRWQLYEEWKPFSRNIVISCKCELKNASDLIHRL